MKKKKKASKTKLKKTKKKKLKLRNKLCQAGRMYARLGWYVLPLHSVKGGRCTCGKRDCGSPGKHPRILKGFKGATRDLAKINEWWNRWPNANIGIRTGIESGLVVLDIDPRNGGKKTLKKIIVKHGKLPETFEVITGGDGQHFYFKHPGKKVKNRKDSFGPGVDIKADGGYIVAPPSLHASGQKYSWADEAGLDDVELAKLPLWIRNKKHKKTNRTKRKSGRISKGERNERLTSIAGSLRNQGMEEEDIFAVLDQINDSRCVPPLSKAEVKGIAESVAMYPSGEERDDSFSTALVKLADKVELFHTPDKKIYGLVPIDNHQECLEVTSQSFEHWLCGQFYKKFRRAVSTQAYQNALGVLVSQGLYDAKEDTVHIRIAGNTSKIFVDLGDSAWTSIKVTAKGWKHLSRHAIHFIRSSTMRHLPEPDRNGRLSELRKYLNLASDEDWALVAGWLVAAMRPQGPYPFLVVTGTQGSAKSTMCRVLGRLVDHQKPALRSQPKSEHDLMIAASRSWVLSFDNLSFVSAKMSDALCRLSTGGGFSTRKLYTDGDEHVFDVMRPLLLNGISDLTSRPDLLDRTISIVLPTISPEERQTEANYWRSFNNSMPRIFGGLLTAVSIALARVDSVELEESPRMADFAKWAVAAEPAFDVKEGTFMRAYLKHRQIQDAEVIASSPVAQAILKFVEKRSKWTGTAQELLQELSKSEFVNLQTREGRAWPKSPRGMGSALRRVAPNLTAMSVEVQFLGKMGHEGTRLITLNKLEDQPPAPPAPPAKMKKKINFKLKKSRKKKIF